MARFYLHQFLVFAAGLASVQVHAFHSQTVLVQRNNIRQLSSVLQAMGDSSSYPDEKNEIGSSRREFLSTSLLGVPTTAALVAAAGFATANQNPEPAEAIGPIKINLLNPTYRAAPCPKDRPIPGEKAMKGLRGLCVTVDVDLEESPEKDLEKIGVYGYVTGMESGESVLANNPDLNTDSGQFAIIPEIRKTDKKTQFDFIAAIPMETDLSPYENGIIPLNFQSLRVVSFPGGQQYGAISPCEMNEFSDECEAWEAENGPYTKGDFMVKSNPRTKGR